MQRPFIYHESTKNLSFLAVSKKLIELGVKNSKFFLRLYDKSLQNIDPYAPDLTDVIKERIISECSINPWYFFREVVRFKNQGGGERPFTLDLTSLASVYLSLNNIDNDVCKSRQLSKDSNAAATIKYIAIFNGAKDVTVTGRNYNDSLTFVNRLNQMVITPDYISNNTKGSVTVTRTLGRFDKKNILVNNQVEIFCDFEFIPYIDSLITENTKEHMRHVALWDTTGKSHCRMFISTPASLKTVGGQFGAKLKNESVLFSEHFYDWGTDTLRKYVEKSSPHNLVYIEHSYLENGKDEEYYEMQIKCLNHSKEVFRREVLLERF